ncbi:RHS repeat-associated core domain-containing protein [Pseudomonas fluorescens]|jgi:RHS repeat-associated protein|uniref:RHS repeat-associated core domain-containing protein n=1 Tax=Pseudomonas fluorescens TaxID=294 RepID=UPI002789A522|nr:RHS repeat-associated core domain-containing protein [Pseudomonas fluorescens]MDP9783339.1 RHS repeat-associated protein [Pseudomonas fluorescens]
MTQIKPKDQEKPSQQRTVLLAVDLKNSVLAELDAGNTNRIAYSPYGHHSAQLEVMSQLGFNGERRETMPERYFLGNGYRVYNPRLMRFHSPDSMSPFGKGGLNAYMYCDGEPVMNSDPTGHFFLRVIAATAVAAVVKKLDDVVVPTLGLTTGQLPIPPISQGIKKLNDFTRQLREWVANIPSQPNTELATKRSFHVLSDRPFGSGSSSSGSSSSGSSSGGSGSSLSYSYRKDVTRPPPKPVRTTGTTGSSGSSGSSGSWGKTK